MSSYAELQCISNFSFLRGASHPEELVAEAARLGYQAIAITDECSLSGVVKAWMQAKEHAIKLIIGSEFHTEEGCHFIALACNREAYSEISALITLARRRAEKGEYRLKFKDLRYNLKQALVIWKPHFNYSRNASFACDLKAWLPNRLWIGVSQLYRNEDTLRLNEAILLANEHHLPLVACGDVHMHTRQRKPLQDTLTAIRHNVALSELGVHLQSNSERHLRPLSVLRQCYPAQLLEETLRIARQCHFALDEIRYNYPQEVVPPGLKPMAYLRQLVARGAEQRWPPEVVERDVIERMQRQIDKEMALIEELNYAYYFLTIYDIVQYARDQKILCQGRGSAANSVVCYCLFITEVPPDKIDLLFERFISRERNEPPDIDVDFEHERREEVIQYIYKKYSRERAALAATLITYRPRSAIRDVGKALGLNPALITRLSQSLAWWDRKNDFEKRFSEQGWQGDAHIAKLFFKLVQEIQGFPRHLSQHVGGFIITQDSISRIVPVENASMADRTVIQWDKESLEAMRLLKVDVLALGMLTAIRKMLNLVEQHEGRAVTLQDIPADDKITYDMLQRGDSVGVFQVESRAQMSMLPRLKPACFYDLVVQVAIVRPGPIQGDMVHPYLRRRNGLEKVEYENSAVRGVLERTLGVPIFQEQVIKLAMVAAGFSGGEADSLRRAMASWGKNGDLLQFERRLKSGMTQRGHSEDFAERLFNQMKGFGAYGFPESHAASFALLVYVSSWLKAHHPAAFYCGLLNSLPMGFYSPSQLIQDAKRHGIEVLPIDVNHSDWDHSLEKHNRRLALRLGLRLVKGLNQDAGECIAQHRPFTGIDVLRKQCRPDQGSLTALAAAGAFNSLNGSRHQANWQVLDMPPDMPLACEPQETYAALPFPSETQNLQADYNKTGLTLGRHPVAIVKEQYPQLARCTPNEALKDLGHRRFARLIGLVTGRQRPGTASGTVFLTLEDETGNANIIVWKSVQERCREALLKSKLLMVTGVIETEQGVVHVIAGDLQDCTHQLPSMSTKSRDFH